MISTINLRNLQLTRTGATWAQNYFSRIPTNNSPPQPVFDQGQLPRIWHLDVAAASEASSKCAEVCPDLRVDPYLTDCRSLLNHVICLVIRNVFSDVVTHATHACTWKPFTLLLEEHLKLEQFWHHNNNSNEQFTIINSQSRRHTRSSVLLSRDQFNGLLG